MSEFKYIYKLAEAYPYSYEKPPICKVELWDFSRANENEEARKEAVTTVASISYGNEYAKNPEKLWNLLIERGHESPFEFLRAGSIQNILNIETLEERQITLWRNFRNREFPTYKQSKKWREHIATFKIKVPIFVARQIQRHRSFSYMEMSRRYVKGDKVEFEFWHHGNALTNFARVYYNSLIEKGARLETARANLPLGLYTTFWMQGDCRAWLNFFLYRLHPEAQEETKLVAEAMWRLLKEHQSEIIKTMAGYLNEWTQDCNPIFTPARKKRAEWFKKEFLKEVEK